MWWVAIDIKPEVVIEILLTRPFLGFVKFAEFNESHSEKTLLCVRFTYSWIEYIKIGSTFGSLDFYITAEQIKAWIYKSIPARKCQSNSDKVTWCF